MGYRLGHLASEGCVWISASGPASKWISSAPLRFTERDSCPTVTNEGPAFAELLAVFWIVLDGLGQVCGGGRGIRTPVTRKGKAVFKTAAINHSAIPPQFQFIRHSAPGLLPA